MYKIAILYKRFFFLQFFQIMPFFIIKLDMNNFPEIFQ